MPDQSDDMTVPPHPPPGSDPLAAALAGLNPAAPVLNRDRLMFEAGAASRLPVIRLWQATAGFLAAIGFFAGWYFVPARVVVQERVITTPQPQPPAK